MKNVHEISGIFLTYFQKVKRVKFLKLENIFALIFLFGAISFAIITPPGQNPDESAHFQRVWQLGNFNLFSEPLIVNGEKSFGGEMPVNISRFFAENDLEYKFDPNHKFNTINTDLTHSLDFNSQTEFQDFRGAGTYSPIAYISMIPGVWIGKALNLPISPLFYLLRAFSIVAVLAFLYAAIRIAPIGKWAFFCVSLIPSVLAQSAAISADGMAMGATILFISYILYLSLKKVTLSWKHLIGLGLLILTIGLSKTAYLPLTILILLLPLFNKNVRNRKNILALITAFILGILPSLIWMGAVSYIDSNYGVGVNITQQRDFILHNPLSYLHIIYVNFFTELNAGMTPVVWLGLFGNFGYLSAPLPTFAVFMLIICLACTLFLRSPREVLWRLSFRTLRTYRSIILITILSGSIAVTTALYIYCSPVKSLLIQGLQGRYFIPFLPLLLLFFYGTVLKNQIPAKKTILIAYCLIAIVALLAAYHRYY